MCALTRIRLNSAFSLGGSELVDPAFGVGIVTARTEVKTRKNLTSEEIPQIRCDTSGFSIVCTGVNRDRKPAEATG